MMTVQTLDPVDLSPAAAGESPFTLALREELRGGKLDRLATFELGDLRVEVMRGVDSVWAIIRRPGKGGLALRAAYAPAGGFSARRVKAEHGEILRIEATSVVGRHTIAFRTSDTDLHRLRMRVWLTPRAPLLVPFLPRDLYVLDADDDPLGATGNVEAAQRGVNSGLLYFRTDEPAFGATLYFQNLTAMNDYFRATGTVPDGAVGGDWPELGYLPPVADKNSPAPDRGLRAGEEIAISDAILVFRDWAGPGEAEMAREFLQMLGAAYKELELPVTEYRDWIGRADRTITDLEKAPEATVRQYGNRYVMPYPNGEYPDVMVQMTVIAALHDYGKWRGEPLPLEAELKRGLERFYDKKLKTLRRYLPNVGDDKDADAVDSWYLYHPMLNLARLALAGDEQAKTLLLKSVDYGIRAAHHFGYAWPIMYDANDFSVKVATRNDERFGQTDVGGIYGYLMLQLHELTGEPRYLDEARAAIDKAMGMRFDLEYQANLTAWGAAACMRLWRITNDDRYRDQGYVYLASFFHNCQIWESNVGCAEHYHTFLGATCLHDAPYMAIYECFEAFAAFEQYLADSGPDLEPAVRMLVSEYCKYTLHRAWFYYPDALPKEIIADPPHQSGTICPNLSFPLEDLYGDGAPPGQVGQEIYGCGAAMVLATRSHHRIEGAPFLLFCNHFVQSMERTGDRALTLQIAGGETCTADLSIVRLKRRKLGRIGVATAVGDAIRPHRETADRIDYHVPASGRLILTWE